MRRLMLPLVLALLAPSLTGCGEPTAITVTAHAVADPATVQVPALSVPKVNLDAGFEAPSSGVGRPQANLSSVGAALGLGTFVRVAEVRVRLGEWVRAGQTLVRFDTAALAIDVTAARADAAVAGSQIGLLDDGIDTTYDKQADVAKARSKVTSAISQLTKLRHQLSGKLSQAKGQLAGLPAALAQVTAQLQQAQAALAALPPTAPPEVRAQLERAIAELSALQQSLTGGLAQLRQIVPKLAAAVKKIRAGLAKARSGLRKLSLARSKIIDARAQLRRVRSLAVVAADAAKLGVTVATTAQAQGTVTAPVDGVVIQVPTQGALLAPGATAAAVRPVTERLTTWLSPAQVTQVCDGDGVTISGDWMRSTHAGRVARIGDAAEYPPTSFPTDEVHLTRAIPVDLTLDGLPDLPVGVPLEVQITPCRPAGSQR